MPADTLIEDDKLSLIDLLEKQEEEIADNLTEGYREKWFRSSSSDGDD